MAKKQKVVFVGSPEFLQAYMDQAAGNGISSLNKAAAQAEIKSVFDTIHEFLAKGEAVNRQGFGKFELRYRAARMGRNPQTGARMQLPASTTVGFKCGKDLRQDVSR